MIKVESFVGFFDTEDISSRATHAVTWALSEGILTGKGGGILDPKGDATRTETAEISTNFAALTQD